MKNKMVVEGNVRVAGVYAMYITENGQEKILYIGSAIEINDALSRHLYHLKRGLYANTNKAILQRFYDLEELRFKVLRESKLVDKISEMSLKDKEAVQRSLEVLEQFYINLYRDTICNKMMIVRKHSSNKNSTSTYKRRRSNLGSKNPNSKFDEEIVSGILWLKENGYKAKDIKRFYESYDINDSYICRIGVNRWIHLEPKKPNFIKDGE
ncbi:hypothetical protein [Clostridium sp.]|uniref:hypothetical protein n=1 Tax=Clostridium sp. TaxID=1506 RepID=UPI003996668F